MGQFYQNQQQNQLAALSGLGGLAGQRTFEPVVTQQQGWLPPIMQTIGGASGGLARFLGGGL